MLVATSIFLFCSFSSSADVVADSRVHLVAWVGKAPSAPRPVTCSPRSRLALPHSGFCSASSQSTYLERNNRCSAPTSGRQRPNPWRVSALRKLFLVMNPFRQINPFPQMRLVHQFLLQSLIAMHRSLPRLPTHQFRTK